MKTIKNSLFFVGGYMLIYSLVWIVRMYCNWDIDSYFWVINRIPNDNTTRALFPMSILAYSLAYMTLYIEHEKENKNIIMWHRLLFMSVIFGSMLIIELSKL